MNNTDCTNLFFTAHVNNLISSSVPGHCFCSMLNSKCQVSNFPYSKVIYDASSTCCSGSRVGPVSPLLLLPFLSFSLSFLLSCPILSGTAGLSCLALVCTVGLSSYLTQLLHLWTQLFLLEVVLYKAFIQANNCMLKLCCNLLQVRSQ